MDANRADVEKPPIASAEVTSTFEKDKNDAGLHDDTLKSKDGFDEINLKGKLSAISDLGATSSSYFPEARVPTKQDRSSWGNKLEFIFMCIGTAVGLGNVWRFPYLCYKNGGGAFLIPYFLMLAFVGLPLFYMELAFGQFASLGPITIWKINRTLKGLGYAMVSLSWLISIYYCVIIAHICMYLFASFAAIGTGIPWTSCDNWWNTELCVSSDYSGNVTTNTTDMRILYVYETRENRTNTTAKPLSDKHRFEGLLGSGTLKTPAEEYYSNFILEQNSGMEELGSVSWKVALCLFLAWSIVLCCVIRGVKSLGKVVYFTALFPYIMLTILLVRGATLPGSLEGMRYYVTPDFSRLTDPWVWSDAATQIFYSMSLCNGCLIAMSSFSNFKNHCYHDTIIISLVNCGTSLYSGCVIFCVLGFMAAEKGVKVEDVAAGGPGLVFVVYPEALSRMPVPQLWSICFFFMMATLGFGTQLSFGETVLSALTDEFPHILRTNSRTSMIFRSAVLFFTFLMGLPMCTKGGIYLLNLVDYSISGFPCLMIGFLEIIAVNWIYGFQKFSDDIKMMLGKEPNIYWKLSWVVFAPIIILMTMILNIVYYKAPKMDNYAYNEAAISLSWCIALFPIMLVVVFFFWVSCRNGLYDLYSGLMKPKPEWGPALPENRTGIYESGASDEGTQCDVGHMWTQARIVLASTPMPSMNNLSIAGNPSQRYTAANASQASIPSLHRVTLMEIASGTENDIMHLSNSLPYERKFHSNSLPVAIGMSQRIRELRVCDDRPAPATQRIEENDIMATTPPAADPQEITIDEAGQPIEGFFI